MNVVTCSHLNKSFGKKQILHDISFEIEEGEIFGFLGPNGAGKTTTIKILTGLLYADSGDVKIMGKSITNQRYEALEYIGAIVENPEFYPYLSGYENLMQFHRALGKNDKGKIDEVVKMVRLENRINDKVKKYSLGMKQRLGVAQAILHQPKLLILDEPTNGLDPQGIKEFRGIVKNLSEKYKMSVFVSSHILSEIEQLCDTALIIDQGTCIEKAKLQGEEKEERYMVSTKKTDCVIECLNKIGVKSSVVENGCEFVLGEKSPFEVIKHLAVNNCEFDEIFARKESLESKFLRITGGEIV